MIKKYRIMRITNSNLWSKTVNGLRPINDFDTLGEAENYLFTMLIDNDEFTIITIYLKS